MEPQATFQEAKRILQPGGVFAAYDYDWPPTTPQWAADAAFSTCMAQMRQLEKARRVSDSLKAWDKSEHLARMQASSCFRYVKEIVVHHLDSGNADRLVGLLGLFQGKPGRIPAAVCLTLALLTLGYVVWRPAHYAAEFDVVQLGFTSAQVQRLVGSPASITDCSTTYGGAIRTQYDPPPPGCTSEYWYYSTWAPEAWSYSFDERGVLIYKYHWVSP